MSPAVHVSAEKHPGRNRHRTDVSARRRPTIGRHVVKAGGCEAVLRLECRRRRGMKAPHTELIHVSAGRLDSQPDVSSRKVMMAAQLTGDQVVSGTPGFMAPEQVLGEKQADARSDLYALGCVAYWLLTGHYVFDGANAIQIMMEHVRGTPLPPSKRT